ncbi:MAG: Rpp14/Pop5 family protein [Candidatus Nanosalina sp.]
MKGAQPAEKESTRYLKFRVHSDSDVEISGFVESFWETSIAFLGTKTLSDTSPWIIANKFDEESGTGVVQVKRDFESDMRAALTLIDGFDGREGFVEVVEVSGVLDKL